MGKNAKSAQAATVIAGADGPTSVFILSHDRNKKEKNPFKRIQTAFRQSTYNRARRRAEKSIAAGCHTMEETVAYIQARYGAQEASFDYPNYRERMLEAKCGLIRRYKPELLGEEKQILPPADLQDPNAVEQWMREIDKAVADQRAAVEAVPYEVFPTDFHMFFIKVEEKAAVTICLDTLYSGFNYSSSGTDKKLMRSIICDIYRYYGVSQTDIDNRTERYKRLLSVLSS